jgi:subtilisin family serine protease
MTVPLAPVAISRHNGRTVRTLVEQCRSALVATIVAALAAVGAVVVSPAPAHADSVRNDQWQLGALNAVAAWQHASGQGMTVAVLDSGVDGNHPDLAGQVLPGLDLVDGTTDGRVDPVGHGTTVAALIAGRRDDTGVVGIAPGAKILPIRVLDQRNRYEDASVIARGLRWAVDHGAQVINLSLGGGAESDVLAGALAYAADHDVVVIACTGNLAQSSGDTEVWFPARQPGVIAVTGLRAPSSTRTPAGGWLDRPTPTGDNDDLWSGSLTGPQTVLSAPAVNLVGARPGGYWRVQGTSFAAPMVSGAAALVRSRYPTLSAANVINRLIRTAHDLGTPGRDDRYGFGLVDPLAALTATVSPVAANPLAPLPDPSGQGGAAHAYDPSRQPKPGDPADKSGSNGDTGGTGGPSDSTNASPHRRTGAIVNGASTGSSLLILVLLVGVLFGASGGHRRAQRYLRRGRHAMK